MRRPATTPWLSRRPLAALAACVVLTGGTAGCSFRGLVFRDDGAIKILGPGSDAKVHLPVHVHWRLEPGLAAPARWAVFVDKTPPARGHGLPTDRTDVLVTHHTRLTLDYLSPQSSGTTEERNQHTITVVMLNAQGRRSSEVSGYVQFEVEQ